MFCSVDDLSIPSIPRLNHDKISVTLLKQNGRRILSCKKAVTFPLKTYVSLSN